MDLARFGRSVRVLRIQRKLRQVDLAAAARVSRSQVARIEQGDAGTMSIRVLDQVATALGADVDVRLRWRGEGLDRLLDAAHAALVEVVAQLLRENSWEVAIEVSFNVAGERGSIDVLAFHPPSQTLLVVEVKSVMPDAQALLAGLDRKSRLGPRIAAERGWRSRQSARLVVIGDTSTTRRRVGLLHETFVVSLPDRGRTVRSWFRSPVGPLAGLLFLPYGRPGRRIHAAPARQRVRVRRVARPLS